MIYILRVTLRVTRHLESLQSLLFIFVPSNTQTHVLLNVYQASSDTFDFNPIRKSFNF